MGSDSFHISLLRLFSFGVSKTDTVIKIKEKDNIILRSWSWKKMGYVRKLYFLKDGKITMQKLS